MGKVLKFRPQDGFVSGLPQAANDNRRPQVQRPELERPPTWAWITAVPVIVIGVMMVVIYDVIVSIRDIRKRG